MNKKIQSNRKKAIKALKQYQGFRAANTLIQTHVNAKGRIEVGYCALGVIGKTLGLSDVELEYMTDDIYTHITNLIGLPERQANQIWRDSDNSMSFEDIANKLDKGEYDD